MADTDRNWLDRVVLDGEALSRLSPSMEADRAQAVMDLEYHNHFTPLTEPAAGQGPFVLHLAITDGRLVLDIRSAEDVPLVLHVLALGPYRRLIKDYQMLVDSHVLAVREGRADRIQAIDMGRRGLHNEGAALMIARLRDRIELDLDTARRLFTLLCVLHQRVDAHT